MAFIVRLVAVAALAAGVSACTTKKTEPPVSSGPSEFGTSVVLTASPDVLPQDGKSQSQVVILARDANGQPLRNLSLRADITVGGTVTDFGTLSQKAISTGSDGRATVVYTAPAPVDNIDRQSMVTISVTPLTGDARGNEPRTIDIRLVPVGTVGGETAVPAFTVSPAAPSQLQTVTFDASDPNLDAALVGYAWDFGDGSKGSGRVASHQFRDAGTYTVTLTVTDVAGRKGSRSRNVAVGTSGLPTASFVFSPSSPGIGQEIAFNAAGSSAVAPRTIVSYDWQFGTDRTGSGIVVLKQYDTPGTYNVTLTVTDDAGNKATTTQAVVVTGDSTAGLTARFDFSPTGPVSGAAVNFNAATSTSADPIVEYRWDFGDGATSVKATATVAHTYAAAGTYVVTLRVKDSKGRTSITTKNVPVS